MTEASDAPVDIALQKRGRRQRRLLLIGTLWVMAWSAFTANDLLQFTNWTHSLPFRSVFNLVVSTLSLVIVVPVAMIGRYIGNFGRLEPFRYHLAIGLPLIAFIALTTPNALDRAFPQRTFERITDASFPTDGKILDYSSRAYGLDHSITIRFSASEPSLIELLDQLGIDGHVIPTSMGPVEETFNLPEPPDRTGVLLKLVVNWSTSTAVFKYVSY